MYIYYNMYILQVVPESGPWKCECDSIQQTVKVSNDSQTKYQASFMD